MIKPPRLFIKLPKFIDMASLFAEISRRPLEEVEAAFARDLEESMKVRPQDAPTKSANKKACFTSQVPNLAYIPPSMSILEVGLATVSGFGKHQIPFDNTFSEAPYSFFTAFGFFELRIPIPNIEWKKIEPRLDVLGKTITLFSIKIPIPHIEWQTIRLPVLTFMTNITTENLELFNVAGDSTVTYFAIGE